MRKNNLKKIVKEAVIKEYYRGFEKDLKDFGFDSVADAARTFFMRDKKLFSVDNFKEIVNNASELSTLSYALDSWKKENPGKDAADLKKDVKVNFDDEKDDKVDKTKDTEKVLNLLDKVFDEFEGIYKDTKDKKLKKSMEYMTKVALANRKDVTEGVLNKLQGK